MKKTTLSFIVLGAFGLYTFWQSTNNPSALTDSIKSLVLSKKDDATTASSLHDDSTPLSQEVASTTPTPTQSEPAPVATTPTTKTITKKVWVSGGDDDDEGGRWVTTTVTVPVIGSNTTPKVSPTPKPVATTPTPVTTPKPVVVTPPAPKTTGQYKDGSYTGSSADAYYGNVQVVAVISGGKIKNIQFLDYPRDRSNSVKINTRATPILAQEAIAAQSANVNAVSGASFTSAAFKESLSVALTQAKA